MMTGLPFNIPAGTTIHFGAPADPLARTIQEEITRGLVSIPAVTEAHLPMCQALGIMPKPAQVLIVVLQPSASLETTMPVILAVVRAALPQDKHLDIWPFRPRDSLLKVVRTANCCLLNRTKVQPWWKFWK